MEIDSNVNDYENAKYIQHYIMLIIVVVQKGIFFIIRSTFTIYYIKMRRKASLLNDIIEQFYWYRILFANFFYVVITISITFNNIV